MKKFAMLAALCGLPMLFATGCNNSPAAKEAAAEKNLNKAEGEEMKTDIQDEADDEKAAVDDAVKDADAEVDAEAGK
jgi:hypothetical protein